MDPELSEREHIKTLLSENHKLIIENNELLKKLNWYHRMSFIMRILWFFVFIGAPFVLYYYVLEPYFSSLGSSFEQFEAGLLEVPGWKQFYEAMGGDATPDAAPPTELQS